MSDLRDARLERALRSAPDDGARPAPAVRRAIRDAAHAALAPAAPVAWWRQWWAGMGRVQPWNAAFASVLLAGVITLLWRHEDVPPASGDRAVPAAAAPPAPATPSTGEARGESAGPAAVPPTGKRSAPARVQPAVPAAVQPPPLPVLRDAAPAAAERQRADAPGSLARSAPAPAREESSAAAPRAETSAGAVPSAPAPSQAPVPSAAAFPAWDALRVERSGRTGTLPRAEAAALAPLLQRATGGVGEEAAVPGAAELRLDLLRDGQSQGVLEVGADWVRWQPVVGAAVTRRDAVLAAALRRAVEALPQKP